MWHTLECISMNTPPPQPRLPRWFQLHLCCELLFGWQIKNKKLKSQLCGFAFSVNPVEMERNQSHEHPTGHHGGQEMVDPRHEEQGNAHGRHGVFQTWGVWSLEPPYPCSAFPRHWTVKAWKTSLAKTGGRQLHVRLWKDLYKTPRAGAT